MIQAKLQTINFEFCAYGDDHSDAMATLLLGLHEHGKQYGLPSDWCQSVVVLWSSRNTMV